jgi:hypothetical protein
MAFWYTDGARALTATEMVWFILLLNTRPTIERAEVFSALMPASRLLGQHGPDARDVAAQRLQARRLPSRRSPAAFAG